MSAVVRREGADLVGYFESFIALARIADRAAKTHPRACVIDRVVRSAIDAFDAFHGREPWGHLVCDAEPLDAQTEDALSQHWAGFEFMPHEIVGDTYQAVDTAIVKSHAFCQTPSFVGGFLAKHAVKEASEIVPWDRMRALDPSCGAGHLLLRLGIEMEILGDRRPYWERQDRRALAKRIIGVELNPYAAKIARWSLSTWLHRRARTESAAGDVGSPLDYTPTVIDADFLDVGGDGRRTPDVAEESMHQLRALARDGAHAVAMNPPYIVEPSASKREYDRARYTSAHRKYGLGPVFLERVLQVASPDAAIANVTSNAFMKREYGKPHIEEVLSKVDLTHVLNTSGAYIPGHGTPTVILLIRNRPPSTSDVFIAQAGRGEPSTPTDPARGVVWSSVVQAYSEYESRRRFAAACGPSVAPVEPTGVVDLPKAALVHKQLDLWGAA